MLLGIDRLLRAPREPSLRALALRSLSGQPQITNLPSVAANQLVAVARADRVLLAFIVQGGSTPAFSPIRPTAVVPGWPVKADEALVFTAHDSYGLVGVDWFAVQAILAPVSVIEVMTPNA